LYRTVDTPVRAGERSPRMTQFASFAASAAPWQNFYILVGTAAATLVGLMFVAITFGASLVNVENAESVRSFVDPTFAHFVQVLFVACLVAIPPMSPWLLGGLLIAIALLRSSVLVRVFRHMREAHRIHNDIELSDWLSGIIIPFVCYLLLGASGVAFILHLAAAWIGLAIVTVGILLTGIFGAWELMMWLALTRARVDAKRPPAEGTG
jgi:hypothetical protein